MKSYYKKIRYIGEYILFQLFTSFLKIIGFRNSVNFCKILAQKIGPYLSVTKIAERNLIRVFGKNVDTSQVIKQIWDNFGRYIGEFPFISTLSDQQMSKILTLEGLENIKHYQDRQQPFIMFLAHLANWDLAIRCVEHLYPKIAIVYRKANNPYVDMAILKTRNSNKKILMIEKGRAGSRILFKAIKDGYSIIMLVDQKMNDGIEVPFFGMPAMTADAIAKISLQYNYPIIPVQIVRTEGADVDVSCFKIIFNPEIKYEVTGDKTRDIYNIMLQINQKVESWIKEKPAQWFWFHNRWK